MTRTTDIEQRASEWMVRSEAPNFTHENGVELEKWLSLDPRHRVSYLRVRAAWRRANRMTYIRPLDGNIDANLLMNSDLSPPEPARNNGSPWTFRVATGAAITLVVYCIGFVTWIFMAPSDWESYSTTIGGYQHVTLADGTIIQLNTNSRIQTRLTAEKREVRLLSGEVLIKVASDAHRPFTVKAAGTAVLAEPSRAQGASVSIRLRAANAVDVSVTAGRVSIGSSYRFIDVALGRMPASDTTLAAGDAATIRPEGLRLARVGLDELNRKLSWTAGLLSFRGETLAEVVEEFNRYNRQQLVVADPTIATRRLGGAFQETDLDSFVAVLEKSFDIHADEPVPTKSGGSIVRLRASNSKGSGQRR